MSELPDSGPCWPDLAGFPASPRLMNTKQNLEERCSFVLAVSLHDDYLIPRLGRRRPTRRACAMLKPLHRSTIAQCSTAAPPAQCTTCCLHFSSNFWVSPSVITSFRCTSIPLVLHLAIKL